jgi:hypothetical protein
MTGVLLMMLASVLSIDPVVLDQPGLEADQTSEPVGPKALVIFRQIHQIQSQRYWSQRQMIQCQTQGVPTPKKGP